MVLPTSSPPSGSLVVNTAQVAVTVSRNGVGVLYAFWDPSGISDGELIGESFGVLRCTSSSMSVLVLFGHVAFMWFTWHKQNNRKLNTTDL